MKKLLLLLSLFAPIQLYCMQPTPTKRLKSLRRVYLAHPAVFSWVQSHTREIKNLLLSDKEQLYDFYYGPLLEAVSLDNETMKHPPSRDLFFSSYGPSRKDFDYLCMELYAHFKIERITND